MTQRSHTAHDVADLEIDCTFLYRLRQGGIVKICITPSHEPLKSGHILSYSRSGVPGEENIGESSKQGSLTVHIGQSDADCVTCILARQRIYPTEEQVRKGLFDCCRKRKTCPKRSDGE